MANPVIIIPAYKRDEALRRLLFSLNNAHFETYPKLIISIDGGGSQEVIDTAKQFKWPGEKKLLIHQNNKGLKEHILYIGDLTEKYDEIIVLEEDLFVSRFFYNYAKSAFAFYKNDASIAGISLYQYQYIELDDMPFIPLVDGFDTYFIQTASSWGQAWNRAQWQKFKIWYNQNKVWDTNDTRLPADVLLWPESSWKKYFIKYLVECNKYFVYPRISLSTNFGDVGTNNAYKNTLHQANLLVGQKNWNFAKYPTGVIYDCHFNTSNLERYIATNRRIEDSDVLELTPIELNITEGLSSKISKSKITQLRKDNYMSYFNLSYKTILKIQNELPPLREQLVSHLKYWFKKKFS